MKLVYGNWSQKWERIMYRKSELKTSESSFKSSFAEEVNVCESLRTFNGGEKEEEKKKEKRKINSAQ